MGVETALTIGSMAAQGVGAGMSFARAKKQKELMNEAQRAAEQATAAADLKLGVNYFEQLAVPMQAYEKERESLISAGAQAMQAGVESERGAAATAGRIQMAQTEAQAGQRAAMGKELSDLAKLTAAEESRLAGLRADLDISEAAANRLRERDAQRARAQAMQQGFAGVTGMIASGAPLIDLYPRKNEKASPEYMQTIQGTVGTGTSNKLIEGQSQLPSLDGFDMSQISKMTPDEYDNFIKNLSPEDKSKLSDYILKMSKGMNFFSID